MEEISSDVLDVLGPTSYIKIQIFLPYKLSLC